MMLKDTAKTTSHDEPEAPNEEQTKELVRQYADRAFPGKWTVVGIYTSLGFEIGQEMLLVVNESVRTDEPTQQSNT